MAFISHKNMLPVESLDKFKDTNCMGMLMSRYQPSALDTSYSLFRYSF